jgi:hypothetical protein
LHFFEDFTVDSIGLVKQEASCLDMVFAA